MIDLDQRLDDLATQATAPRPVPEAGTVLRRGRQRRRRQLAGAVVLLIAVVTAGAVAVPRTWQAVAPTPLAPAGPPPERVNRFLGWWQDNIDASIFLRQDTDAADRQALVRRLTTLPEVDRVWVETRQQALDHYKAMFWDRQDMTRNLHAAALPEALRVRLRGPDAFERLHAHLCGTARPTAKLCSPTIDLVTDQRTALFRTLSGRAWAGRVDASVLLDPRASQAAVAAVRRALDATPGVTHVAYESRAAAINRFLTEFGRKSHRNRGGRGRGAGAKPALGDGGGD